MNYRCSRIYGLVRTIFIYVTFQRRACYRYARPLAARFYCEIGTAEPVACPRGSYCLPGTQWGDQHKCPEGTFGDATNLVDANECSACTAGKSLEQAGYDDLIGVVAAHCFGLFQRVYGALVTVLPWDSNYARSGSRKSRAELVCDPHVACSHSSHTCATHQPSTYRGRSGSLMFGSVLALPRP